MSLKRNKLKGFTLIELMIVMSIVALLMAMVGPLAINSLEKAQAKQEMLTLKNWLRKVSYQSYSTGEALAVKLEGKTVTLFTQSSSKNSPLLNELENYTFDSLFFQPQQLNYSRQGFVVPDKITGSYRGRPLDLNLSVWINGQEDNTILSEY
jgi:prepilin-type N-terminal cleavage/methylation domain-containing protein